MRYCIWILSLLGLLFGQSHAFAHGAIAVSEDDRGQAQVQYSFDDATLDEAQSEALLDCASAVQRTCVLVATYKDTCAGFARLFPNQYFVRLAPDADSAKQAALSACFSAYPGKLAETACPRYNFVYCDRTPVSYQSSAPATQTFDYGSQQRSPFNEPLVVWYWIGLFVFVIFLIAWILKTPGRQATPSIQAASGVPSTALSSHETVDQPHSSQVSDEPIPTTASASSVALPQKIPPISDPPEGMFLKVKKTTKSDFLGRIVYMIDARLDASAQIRAQISKHCLGGKLVYESDKRQKYLEMAQHRAEQTRAQPRFTASADEQLKGTATTFFRLGQAIYNRVRAAVELKITVDKLLSGIHVECKDVDELGEAEAAIIAAKQNLEGYLDEFSTFDGREQIY
jgi:hypothetical protein